MANFESARVQYSTFVDTVTDTDTNNSGFKSFAQVLIISHVSPNINRECSDIAKTKQTSMNSESKYFHSCG